MSNINDGGPAYPNRTRGEQGAGPGRAFVHGEDHPGMSLRDHFAGLAMQGELAAMACTEAEQSSGLALDISDEGLSRLATHWYRIADAMIAARGGK